MAQKEAKIIADQLAKDGAPAGLEKKEIIPLIAYLQALGQKPVLSKTAEGAKQ